MRHLILRLAVLAALMPLAFSCGGGAPSADLDAPADAAVGDAATAPATGLPSLDGLPAATGGPTSRRVSAAQYELLLFEPVLFSPDETAVHADNTLALHPDYDNNVLAWAVYALPGFPTDGTVLPTKLTIDKGSDRCWIGISDYAQGCWRLMQVYYDSEIPLENAADLIAPDGDNAGTLYIAVIADWGEPEASSLAITTDNDLPGSPVAVLNVPDVIYEGIQVEFDAVGSNGGDGNITEIYWDFGDEGGNVTYDPATVVYHTYLETGTYNVSIEVHNDLERVGFASEEVQVESYDYVQDLLIIYNSDMPEDLDLVNYYSSPTTGRGIDPDYRLGLPLGAEAGVEISITTFETDILPPIKAFLDDVANAEIKANIKYLLLMKGVPYKIKGENEFDIYLSTHSTVDSELCCLYSYGEYETTSFLWNQRTYEGFTSDESQSFFLTSDDDFVPDAYLASDIAGTTYPVNYLVGRLSAYNYDEAKLLVDRSLSADTSGQGWIILDSKPSIAARDTMVEPVWPLTDPTPNANWPSAYTLLSDAGLNVYLDTTDTKVTSETEDLPAGVTEIGVIGYDSHGKHSGFHEEYILNLLGFDYLPGACFMSIESFNCYDLDDTDGSIDRNGQGLIGDFFRMGGTVAIGTAWEPYVRGVGDERWVFDRYLHYGDIWIEAAYKGMRCLSWQEVVLGDPLCRVVAE